MKRFRLMSMFAYSRSPLAGGLTAAALTLFGAASAVAAVPANTLVEGILTSSGGGAAADGTYKATFALYKDASGGNPVWTEAEVSIGVKGGVFSYALGSKTALDQKVLNDLAGKAWLGIKIDADPELPLKPLSSVLYAIRAGSAEGLECSGCVKASHIDAGVFASFAKTSDLSKVAVTGNFADLNGGPDLSAYAKTAALAKVATSGAFADLTGGPDLSAYAKLASLADVAKSGNYADLKGLPVLAKVATTGEYADLKNAPAGVKTNASCGTGLVMKGIKTDGTYECVQAMDPKAFPPDAIDEISNGLVANQFVDSTAGTPDVVIKDGYLFGVADNLVFPDIGIAQKLTVSVDISNSNISTIQVSVFDPAGVEHLLHKAGTGSGNSLKTAFPDPTKQVSEDLNTWIGKNPKGTWTIKVVDSGSATGSGVDGKINKWSVDIQTLSNKKVQVKGDLIVSGDLTVNGVNYAQTNGNLPATYRRAVFQTHQHSTTSWFMGNNNAMFGGVHPSNWTDGNHGAAQISADKEVQRTLYQEKRYAGKNALVCAELINMHSSTNGCVCTALFRVKNSTGGAITWTPHFYYTSYDGWSERAQVALNGSQLWQAGNTSNTSLNISIPANRVSTVIFSVTSSHPYTYLSNHHERATYLGFYNNSLALPTGLQFIDDLDTAKGGYEQ